MFHGHPSWAWTFCDVPGMNITNDKHGFQDGSNFRLRYIKLFGSQTACLVQAECGPALGARFYVKLGLQDTWDHTLHVIASVAWDDSIRLCYQVWLWVNIAGFVQSMFHVCTFETDGCVVSAFNRLHNDLKSCRHAKVLVLFGFIYIILLSRVVIVPSIPTSILGGVFTSWFFIQCN